MLKEIEKNISLMIESGKTIFEMMEYLNEKLMEGKYEVIKFNEELFHISFRIFRVNGTEQIFYETTLYDCLRYMDKNNGHYKGKDSSSYHKESLILHSLLVGLEYMQRRSDEIRIEYGMIGAIFHDFGKADACEVVRTPHGNFLANYFHSEISAMMLRCAFLSFKGIVDERQWRIITRSVELHMNLGSIRTEEMARSLFSLEEDGLIEYLERLINSDHSGRFEEKEGKVIYMRNDDFKIVERSDFESICSKNKLCGVLIIVRGSSGSGKTTFSSMLKNEFPNIVSVERDLMMVQTVAEEKGIEIPTIVPCGKEYQEMYSYSKENKLSGKIDRRMRETIIELLKDGKIVIVDTVATLYEDAIKNVIPPFSTSMCFVMAIDVVRQEMIKEEDADRRGVSINDQVKRMFGERRGFLHIDGKIRSLKNFSSKYARTSDNAKTYNLAHMTFSVVWNNEMMVGVDNVYEIIRKMKGIHYDVSLDGIQKLPLVELVKKLWEVGGIELIEAFLSEYSVRISKTILDDYIVIKCEYLDRCKFWFQFVLESRGTYLAIRKIDGTVLLIRKLMMRGSELFLLSHMKHGITESDVENGMMKLDDEQEISRKQINEGTVVDGIMTSKVDGSLFGVSVYPNDNEVRNVMISYLRGCNSKLVKSIFEFYEKNGILIIPATRGTLVMDDGAIPYFSKAIIEGYYGEEKMEDWTDRFFGDIMKFWRMVGVKREIFVSFEAVCKDRIGYDGKEHIELAISYDRSMLRFLGITIEGTFYPHSNFVEQVRMMNFDEPYWWNVSGDGAVRLLEGITKISMGEIDKDEFIRMYPPMNNTKNDVIDMEGFVFLRRTDNGYTYSKLKTEVYYIGHKFRMWNLRKIFSVPDRISRMFPMIKKVQETFSNIKMKLWNCLERCRVIVDKYVEEQEAVKERFERIGIERSKWMKMIVLGSFFKDDEKLWYIVREFVEKELFEVFNETFRMLKMDKNVMWGIQGKNTTRYVCEGIISFITDNSEIDEETFNEKMDEEMTAMNGVMKTLSDLI